MSAMSSVTPQLPTNSPAESEEPPKSPVNKLLMDALKRRLDAAGEVNSIAVWLRDVLKVSYTSAFRRANARAPIAEADLPPIALGLGTSLHGLLIEMAMAADGHYPAVVRIPGLPRSGWLELGAKASRIHDGIVAVKREGQWEVVEAKSVKADESPYRVLRLVTDTPSEPRVALLEDDAQSAQSSSDTLEELGARVTVFSEASELERAIAAGTFDALVLDWFLADGKTSAALVEHVRSQPRTADLPVFIVTGQAETLGVPKVAELGRFAARFDCQVREKPVRWAWIMAEIEKSLEGPKTATVPKAGS
jgi:CheY-like chemotaxis protein